MSKSTNWNPNEVLETVRQYQLPAVIMAAAELDVFALLKPRAGSAAEVARSLKCDKRAIRTLLDALTAARLLIKKAGRYSLARGVDGTLVEGSPDNVLGMVRHQANCYRRWGDLAMSVRKGKAPRPRPSVRGEQDDLESFIETMHNVSAPVASEVVRSVRPAGFKRLLDIGGASGTWTLAFLSGCRSGRAILFDLPDVIPLARKRAGSSKFGKRMEFIAGDYNRDALPPGCDLAWLSAIVHQNSMAENLDLFQRVYAALVPGGRIAIRDIVMREDRVSPPAGAFFAVNMLVGTKAGGTFTFSETSDALKEAGFRNVRLARRDPGMHSIIIATKPGKRV